MQKKELCPFGLEIAHALVDINQPNVWLIDEVKRDTGLYFDRSYLHKIMVGTLSTPAIVESIKRILKIN